MSNPSMQLQAPEEYREGRQQIYPSPESFRWFVRQNREELVAAGAIVCPTKRWLVQPEAFDQAVMQIGQRRARKG
jgi:hypothetical protein